VDGIEHRPTRRRSPATCSGRRDSGCAAGRGPFGVCAVAFAPLNNALIISGPGAFDTCLSAKNFLQANTFREWTIIDNTNRNKYAGAFNSSAPQIGTQCTLTRGPIHRLRWTTRGTLGRGRRNGAQSTTRLARCLEALQRSTQYYRSAPPAPKRLQRPIPFRALSLCYTGLRCRAWQEPTVLARNAAAASDARARHNRQPRSEMQRMSHTANR
jgi:hypothetical protein